MLTDTLIVRDGFLHGVTWVLIRERRGGREVLLEKCPKKAKVLGVGEWFVPGGKINPGERPEDALVREMREEWGPVGYHVAWRRLPVLEGSPVPANPASGMFLMVPFAVDVLGDPPPVTVDEGVPLSWVPVVTAISSPVLQVRMMVAAAL